MAYSYENELNAMKDAQKKSAIADLENTRNKALSDLQSEQTTNKSNYASQRNTTNVQNKLSSRNFQEYLATTGRANSGLGSQARLQNSNNLNTNINSINSAETASNSDIARRTTDTNNTYNSGVASANATIEANYLTRLLEQRQKAMENELAERQYQESIRQFNEQMAYNYKNLYSNFKKGSGGGSSSKSSGTSSSDFTNGSSKATKQYNSPIGPGLLPGEEEWYSKIVKNSKKTSKKSSKNSVSYSKAKSSANKSGITLKYKK